MNLLVTGGAGFIGSHFVRSVLADRLPGLAGASVTVLDTMAYGGSFANLSAVSESERLDFVPADAGDAPVVGAALRGHDAVLHFAASGSGSDVAATEVLLAAALRHDVERFVQISTASVYGSIETGAWTERSPLGPRTPAAAARAGADLLALAYHHTHGLPVTITRGSATYGPYQHPAAPLPRLVTDLLTGRPARLPDDGTRVRDWLHVDDHCRAVALALLEGRPGETYHIGGSLELSDHDLATLVRTELAQGDLAPGHNLPTAHRQVLDDDKIRRELGWRPRVEFATGLTSTIRWYRDNPSWWRPLLPD